MELTWGESQIDDVGDGSLVMVMVALVMHDVHLLGRQAGLMSKRCHICKKNQTVSVVVWRNSPAYREADTDWDGCLEILDYCGFQEFGQPQAFWSQCWQINFSKVSFCAKSIFVVCQAVSLAVLQSPYRPKSKMAAGQRLGKFWVAISPKRVIQSTSCLVLWWGFRDWRIDWHHLRFNQIQDDAHGRHMYHKVLHYLEKTVFSWTWTPVNVLVVLLDYTMNTHFLSQVQWYILLTDSIWIAFDHGTWSTTDNKAPQHLERWFFHKSKSTFGPFLLDQTMNTHFLSPLQWLILLPGFTWEPCHPWKTKTL